MLNEDRPHLALKKLDARSIGGISARSFERTQKRKDAKHQR
jgi:hypothetical protein